MEIYDVITKIIGNINPAGESHIDEKRFKNLQSHEDITYQLVDDLIYVVGYKTRQEYSMKKMGLSAYRQLLEIKGMIDRIIE